jgi:hypothetical protein
MTRARSRSPRRRLFPAIILGLYLMLHGVVALAGQGEEASIIGRVTDESGAVMPGVTVTATSPALQVGQLADLTNERGEYRLTPLPIGTYTVEYSLSGFQTVRREGLRVTAGFVAKMDEVMKIGALAETLTVSGAAPIVDVQSTASRTNLMREALETIPVGDSGYQALLAQAPGVRTNIDVGGNTAGQNPVFRVFGQNGDSWSAYEGVLTTSPKSGTQGGNYFDYDSIQEATVQTTGTNAEAVTHGVQVNVLLKSGGNEFHGTGIFSGTGSGLASDNLDSTLKARGITSGQQVSKRWEAFGDLGGRIVPNKLWFYYAGRGRAETDGVLGNFLKPDGSPVDAGKDIDFSTEKASYQVNPSNRLIGFHQLNYQNYTNYTASQFSPWDSRTQAIFWVNTSKIEWQYAKGNRVASLQFGYWNWHVIYTGFSDQASTTDQITSAITGDSSTAGISSFEDRKHTRGSFAWYKPDVLVGNHELKAGFDYFGAHADRKAIDRGAAGNYQLIYRNGVPFEVNSFNNPVVPFDVVRYLGTYLQDTWSVTRQLTLNLGVRYAHDHGFVPPQCRVAALAPFTGVYPAQCFSQLNFKTWNPVVPRLNAAYDVTGSGKTLIKGGWGRYAHERYVDELQMANPNVPLYTFYRWHASTGSTMFVPGQADLSLSGPDFVSQVTQAGPALAGAVPNPNEKEPLIDDFSLSIERELIPNFAVRVTGIYSRTLNAYRVQNNLRPYGVYNIPVTTLDPGPDGKLGTADDPGTAITYDEYSKAYAPASFQQPMLINDPNANQTYKTLEVAATKRLSSRWQVMASYSATKSHIPFVQNTSGVGDFITPGLTVFLATYDPNAEIFAANNTWEWNATASGSYNLPWNVLVSGHFENRSGVPFARTVSATGGVTIPSITVRVDPIGTYRTPSVNLTDFRIEKSIALGQTRKVALRVNVYNLLNSNTVTGLTQLSGPNFLLPSAILPARLLEFGVAYRF